MAEIKFNYTFFPKVCLCGSTRFKDDFIKVAKNLTLMNCIVTMPMIFGHSGDKVTDKQKQQLDELHRAKIRDADIIIVINTNDYIGESTQKEIEYAKSLGKPIVYTENEPVPYSLGVFDEDPIFFYQEKRLY